ncbi:MaoC family dehydratase [Ferrimonas pelagia]|uniref:3-hydroxyacyl-thioester dehydratase HtdZ n=1 Tax=Ferrimonas pelagia TaxID=1177826 RepID=A0ABP9ENK4_9GAMM
MAQFNFDDVAGMQALVSEEFGPWSNAVTIDQALINRFAELSGDDYWLHTDVEKCAKYSPFKGTIAHGFLTLILLPKMRAEQPFEVVGFNNMLNVGSDRLRFTGVVPVGAQVQSRTRLKAVEATKKGTAVTLEQHVHVVGEARPALIYDMIFMYM